MDMEDFGRRAVPMVVRMNTRNAIRLIHAMKKLDLKARDHGPVTHVYPETHEKKFIHKTVHVVAEPEPEPSYHSHVYAHHPFLHHHPHISHLHHGFRHHHLPHFGLHLGHHALGHGFGHFF